MATDNSLSYPDNIAQSADNPRELDMDPAACEELLRQFCQDRDISGIHEHFKYYDLSHSHYYRVIYELSAQGNIQSLRPFFKNPRTEWQKSIFSKKEFLGFAMYTAICHNQKPLVDYLNQLYKEQFSAPAREIENSQPFSVEVAQNPRNFRISISLPYKSNSDYSSFSSVDMAQYLLEQTNRKAFFIYKQLEEFAYTPPHKEELKIQFFQFLTKEFLKLPDINTEDKQWFMNLAAFTASRGASTKLVDYCLSSPELSIHANVRANLPELVKNNTQLLDILSEKINIQADYFQGSIESVKSQFNIEQVNNLFYGACLSRKLGFLEHMLAREPVIIKPHIAGLGYLLKFSHQMSEAVPLVEKLLELGSKETLDMTLCHDKRSFGELLVRWAHYPKGNQTLKKLFTSSNINNPLGLGLNHQGLFKEACRAQNIELLHYLLSEGNALLELQQNKLIGFLSSRLNPKSLGFFLRKNSLSEDIISLLNNYQEIHKEKGLLEQAFLGSTPFQKPQALLEKSDKSLPGTSELVSEGIKKKPHKI